MKIGKWNEITQIDKNLSDKNNSFNFKSPENSNQLYRFSLVVTEWITNGEWHILQLDNSNSFTLNETILLSRLISDIGEIINFNIIENSTFLFEMANDAQSRVNDKIRIAGIIYFMLLFGGHGYFLSSEDHGDYLGIHDGFVYFIGKDEGLERARLLLTKFETRQATWPQWLMEAEVAWQEQALRKNP